MEQVSQASDWDEQTAVHEAHGAYVMGVEDGTAEGLLCGTQSYWRIVASASSRELKPEERDAYARGFLAGVELGAKARRQQVCGERECFTGHRLRDKMQKAPSRSPGQKD